MIVGLGHLDTAGLLQTELRARPDYALDAGGIGIPAVSEFRRAEVPGCRSGRSQTYDPFRNSWRVGSKRKE
jgi:hypothetical protein